MLNLSPDRTEPISAIICDHYEIILHLQACTYTRRRNHIAFSTNFDTCCHIHMHTSVDTCSILRSVTNASATKSPMANVMTSCLSSFAQNESIWKFAVVDIAPPSITASSSSTISIPFSASVFHSQTCHKRTRTHTTYCYMNSACDT